MILLTKWSKNVLSFKAPKDIMSNYQLLAAYFLS